MINVCFRGSSLAINSRSQFSDELVSGTRYKGGICIEDGSFFEGNGSHLAHQHGIAIVFCRK